MDKYDQFKERILPEVIELIEHCKKFIGEEYRSVSQDVDDNTPMMDITISCDDSLEEWTYQTGDNSYTGSCYHYPYWGVTSIDRESNSKEIAEYLIDDMLENMYW